MGHGLILIRKHTFWDPDYRRSSEGRTQKEKENYQSFQKELRDLAPNQQTLDVNLEES